jgi:hypothetical protein
MTPPGRTDAALLLASLAPPEWFVRHACAVADVAAWLAGRTAANGLLVDVAAIEAGALLHDLDKLPAAGAPVELRHGEGSGAVLEARGLARLAPLVRDHPVTRLAEPRSAAWLASASSGALIVAYADKRAGQRLESMAERFASWRRRYPSAGGWDDATLALVWARAFELERIVCDAAGVAPDEVRRLRWSRRALAAARRTMPAHAHAA